MRPFRPPARERKRKISRLLVDMTGNVYGELTVLRLAEKTDKKARAFWHCRCSCGSERIVAGENLRSGNSKSCGCLPRRHMDISGQMFGRWTAISRSKKDHWLCRCACGVERDVLLGTLRYGSSQSCGCWTRERTSAVRSRDIAGKKFGRLTAVEFVGERRRGSRMWKFICDCGAVKVTSVYSVTSGDCTSCGCAKLKYGLTLDKEGSRRACNRDHATKRRAAEMNSDGAFSETEVRALFFKQHGKCANCGTKILSGKFHRDHIMPLSRGGSNRIGNIQLLCVPCNLRKGSKDPFRFAQERGRLL